MAGCVASSGDSPSPGAEAGVPPAASTASFASSGATAPSQSRASATRSDPTSSSAGGTIGTRAASGSQIPVSTVSEPLPASEVAAVSAATAVSTPGSEGYRVGPLDVLDIKVFKVEDLSKTVQVSESGNFTFPLVGDVQASGRTVSEIEKDLATKLGGNYLRNPQVTVLVKEYNSHRITVDGAVNKPGVFPMQGPMSLLQSVAMAGGMQEVADGTILVFRRIEGKTAVAKFSVSDLRSQKASDPDLQAGDIVTVPSSDLKIGMKYILQSVPLFNSFLLL
ncbi:polysaccharide biosynthesis/export family protein [Ancylobacter vacuolatus]|uniref:Polysaccharide export outer membrane protein n=1 Tax=Ancylobacter vacuolatus TaxID=223389 RepID=A0ABU0DKN2_9HYPH|nr:polysaccharide biosynthesis/export family protein [Ancylobacter vacuolatus]MDQ0348992.1 polysaccharide export outer membrane protein [Ancylobacter vacuolatus]